MAVALTTSHGSSPVAPETVAEQLRWGAGWLEALPWVRRLHDAASSTAQAAVCLDLFAVIGEQPRFRGMAIAAVNDLATRLRCDRVSLGIVGRNGMVKMRAMSHSATFKDQGRLVDNIENAMEEAVDQSRPIAYPPLPSTERAISIAHRALAELVKTPGASVMSVVLADSDGSLIGALTFERFSTVPFDKGLLQLAEAIAALLGPVVGLQLRANRLVAGRIVDRLGDGLLALIGPRRSSVKLGAVALEPSLTIAWANMVAVVVPSPAWPGANRRKLETTGKPSYIRDDHRSSAQHKQSARPSSLPVAASHGCRCCRIITCSDPA